MITVLGSIININGKTYMCDNLISTGMFTNIMNKIIIQGLRFMQKVVTTLIWIELVTIFC